MSDHVTSARTDAPRRVDLAIARIDAWTVMKVSFLLSVALGIALVIATIVLWLMVDAMHVFSQIEEFLQTVGCWSLRRPPRLCAPAPRHLLRDHRRCHQRHSAHRPVDAGCHALQRRRVPGGRHQGVSHGRVRTSRARGRLTSAPFAMPVCVCVCVLVPGGGDRLGSGCLRVLLCSSFGCTWIGSGYMDRLCVCG